MELVATNAADEDAVAAEAVAGAVRSLAVTSSLFNQFYSNFDRCETYLYLASPPLREPTLQPLDDVGVESIELSSNTSSKC